MTNHMKAGCDSQLAYGKELAWQHANYISLKSLKFKQGD